MPGMGALNGSPSLLDLTPRTYLSLTVKFLKLLPRAGTSLATLVF
jgi:hypothetical protein